MKGRLPLLALLAALSLIASSPACSDEDPAFVVEPLDEGIWLYRATDEPGGTNSLVVERADGLLVVDAQPTPEAGRRLVAEIRRRHDAPLRYLVLSHPHAEAMGGASAFPHDTLVIATKAAREALLDPQHDFAAEMPYLVGRESWSDPPRPSPVLLLNAVTDLDDPRNPVVLVPVVSSHSPGDLVVYLKDAQVLYAGSLLFEGASPYGGQADLGHWTDTLNNFLRRPPRRIAALRGPIQDIEAVRRQRDALVWLRLQVGEGFVSRLSPEAIAERVMADPGLAERFGPAERNPFLETMIHRSIEEVQELRRRRGDEPG